MIRNRIAQASTELSLFRALVGLLIASPLVGFIGDCRKTRSQKRRRLPAPQTGTLQQRFSLVLLVLYIYSNITFAHNYKLVSCPGSLRSARPCAQNCRGSWTAASK